MANPIRWNVAPRYSPGSPAQVDFATAQQVAADEQRGYEYALRGVYGEEQQAQARERGLDRIVWSQQEIQNCWRVQDYLTGRTYVVLPFVRLEVRRGRLARVERGDVIAFRQEGGSLLYTHGKVDRIETNRPRRSRPLQVQDFFVLTDGRRVGAPSVLGVRP